MSLFSFTKFLEIFFIFVSSFLSKLSFISLFLLVSAEGATCAFYVNSSSSLESELITIVSTSFLERCRFTWFSILHFVFCKDWVIVFKSSSAQIVARIEPFRVDDILDVKRNFFNAHATLKILIKGHLCAFCVFKMNDFSAVLYCIFFNLNWVWSSEINSKPCKCFELEINSYRDNFITDLVSVPPALLDPVWVEHWFVKGQAIIITFRQQMRW